MPKLKYIKYRVKDINLNYLKFVYKPHKKFIDQNQKYSLITFDPRNAKSIIFSH